MMAVSSRMRDGTRVQAPWIHQDQWANPRPSPLRHCGRVLTPWDILSSFGIIREHWWIPIHKTKSRLPQGIGHPLSHHPLYRPCMNECKTPDEQFVYQERLALLDVLNGDPTEQQHTLAMQDVRDYRVRLSELLAQLG